MPCKMISIARLLICSLCSPLLTSHVSTLVKECSSAPYRMNALPFVPSPSHGYTWSSQLLLPPRFLVGSRTFSLLEMNDFPSPLFDGPINLGPAASLRVNPVLLDPPHLGQSSVLQLSTSLPHISWGATQYHHSFYKGGPLIPLLSLRPDTHFLPDNYLAHLLEYEGWPTADSLFPIPNNSVSGEDVSTLSIWCPDQDTAPSPSHSITLCCGAAYSANASSHGPTFGYRDWHAKSHGKGWRSWFPTLLNMNPSLSSSVVSLTTGLAI